MLCEVKGRSRAVVRASGHPWARTTRRRPAARANCRRRGRRRCGYSSPSAPSVAQFAQGADCGRPVYRAGARFIAAGAVCNLHVFDKADAACQHGAHVLAHDVAVIDIVEQLQARAASAAQTRSPSVSAFSVNCHSMQADNCLSGLPFRSAGCRLSGAVANRPLLCIWFRTSPRAGCHKCAARRTPS